MARSFTASDSISLTTFPSVFNGYTGAFTMSLWLYMVAVTTAFRFTTYIGDPGASARGYFILPQSISGTTRWGGTFCGAAVLDSGETLTTGTWHHLALRYSGSNAWNLWRDSAQRANGTNSPIACNGATDVAHLGANAGVSSAMYIADSAVWQVYLTDAELTALSKGIRPNKIRPNPTMYFPLDGLQSPEPDLSGNANNGILTGTTFIAGPPLAMFTPRWRQLELPSGVTATTKFRKSASRIGTRTGTRQTWAA